MTSPELLNRLVAEAREASEKRRRATSLATLEREAAEYAPKDFAAALRRHRLAVIAEMKQRTPSMGVLAGDFRPDRLAEAYTEGGAAAISVLTQEASFGGSLEHLRTARAHSPLPILRKDFISDPYEVVEARAAGADAVLLIVAALEPEQLAELMRAAGEHGVAALVEVHDEHEAETAVRAGAALVGVNHRDLRTFKIDLGLTQRLRAIIPGDRLLVSESGIHSRADARRLREGGAGAILVGELLMTASDPASCIRELASA